MYTSRPTSTTPPPVEFPSHARHLRHPQSRPLPPLPEPCYDDGNDDDDLEEEILEDLIPAPLFSSGRARTPNRIHEAILELERSHPHIHTRSRSSTTASIHYPSSSSRPSSRLSVRSTTPSISSPSPSPSPSPALCFRCSTPTVPVPPAPRGPRLHRSHSHATAPTPSCWAAPTSPALNRASTPEPSDPGGRPLLRRMSTPKRSSLRSLWKKESDGSLSGGYDERTR
ncbi:uncharacterized protein EI97DRAFT_504825 [Westerdykella ornata]|uniref:Uncharacterized protein n=1 Tax=Westerdykella ornata TaxID=318751 RepID=A0A6A6J5H3_WESOR|nr:uncharacterized protein EI97DRAFT_504825 [Westerdykella ornata]KAF2271685.1 hypothetical protein EI97DRAFT_504825 [Westerdykella ornata]